MTAARTKQREDARKKQTVGWTAWEPGVLGLAVLLLILSSIFPWWGIAQDTSVAAFENSRGTDFGPWMAEEWQFSLLPGSVRREATLFAWWDYVEANPEHAGYGFVAVSLLSLWGLALAASLGALSTRLRPQSRLGGWPTVLLGLSTGAMVAAAVVAVLGFPPAVEASSFLGVSGRLSWGPKVGWFVAIASTVLLGVATVLGRRVDRRLAGRCWKCHRESPGRRCGYCGASQ